MDTGNQIPPHLPYLHRSPAHRTRLRQAGLRAGSVYKREESPLFALRPSLRLRLRPRGASAPEGRASGSERAVSAPEGKGRRRRPEPHCSRQTKHWDFGAGRLGGI